MIYGLNFGTHITYVDVPNLVSRDTFIEMCHMREGCCPIVQEAQQLTFSQPTALTVADFIRPIQAVRSLLDGEYLEAQFRDWRLDPRKGTPDRWIHLNRMVVHAANAQGWGTWEGAPKNWNNMCREAVMSHFTQMQALRTEAQPIPEYVGKGRRAYRVERQQRISSGIHGASLTSTTSITVDGKTHLLPMNDHDRP